jgi:hypothetical protein
MLLCKGDSRGLALPHAALFWLFLHNEQVLRVAKQKHPPPRITRPYVELNSLIDGYRRLQRSSRLHCMLLHIMPTSVHRFSGTIVCSCDLEP